MTVRRVMVSYSQIRNNRVPGTVELAALRQSGFDMRRPFSRYERPEHDAVEFIQEVEE